MNWVADENVDEALVRACAREVMKSGAWPNSRLGSPTLTCCAKHTGALRC